MMFLFDTLLLLHLENLMLCFGPSDGVCVCVCEGKSKCDLQTGAVWKLPDAA